MSIRRRDLLKAGVAWPLAGAALVGLPACEKVTADTPRAIKYGRDVCDQCAMLVSEPRYAAQLWNPAKKRFHVFDDIGCALVHGAETGLAKDAAARLWVADYEAPDTWLDAGTAHYRTGMISPMGYGFAALRTPAPDRVSLAEVRTQALQRAGCDVGGEPVNS